MLITICVLGNLFDRPINVKPVIFFLYTGVLSKLPNPPRDKLPWGPNSIILFELVLLIAFNKPTLLFITDFD